MKTVDTNAQLRDSAHESSRVLFIGLDAAEPLLLQRFMSEGKLPAIASLVGRGSSTIFRCPPGIANGGTWPAAFTGTGPASNGRYYYLQFDPATYRFVEFNQDSDFSSPPLWMLASEVGKRVAVIDMVRGPLTLGINGVQLADWLGHDRTLPARSAPPELIGLVESEFGEDPWHGHADNAFRRAADKDPSAWLQATIRRIDQKGACSKRLLQAEKWDLFATVFSEPHDFGHLFWHLCDSAHPDFDKEWFERHGDPLEAVLAAIDRNIADLIETAGPDTHVILFTGPGMGPNYSANGTVDQILQRLESSYTRKSARARARSLLRTVYQRTLPSSIRQRLRLTRRVSAIGSKVPDDFDPRYLSGRRFFAVPNNDSAGAVRLNIAGREARGILSPSEADSLLRRIASDLLEIRNADTGEPLISELVITKDQYAGPVANNLPDLLMIWNRPQPIRRIVSSRIGILQLEQNSIRTGDHNGDAFFAVSHAIDEPVGIDCSQLCAEDITPTILDLMGVPPSQRFDGTSRVKRAGGTSKREQT